MDPLEHIPPLEGPALGVGRQKIRGRALGRGGIIRQFFEKRVALSPMKIVAGAKNL